MHDPTATSTRKSLPIELGAWAITTGRGWLVHAVENALEREGLQDG
jgi:hypothetical protein